MPGEARNVCPTNALYFFELAIYAAMSSAAATMTSLTRSENHARYSCGSPIADDVNVCMVDS